MPLLSFLVLTTVGSGLWNGAFIGLGWLLGENWDAIEAWVGPISKVIVGALLVGVVILIVRRLRSDPESPDRTSADVNA